MAKPTIRFKGYTDDWEQRKLGEITELKSASRVHKDEWTSNGVPFYRSSDVMAAINGTENEKAFISEELYEKLSKVSGKLEEGDILVTGGGSVGNPYIVLDNKPLYTKDADLLWIKNKGKFHPYFLYEFFFSPTFRNYLRSISHVGTIAHYTITQLSDTPIYLPSFEEQKEVGEYFQSLDHLITLHQRKCEETKILKKYMLQKMFPQNEQKVPEIRFKGFTDDWEQRKLGELYQRNTERNENLIGYDKTISVATMSYKDDGNGASESSLSTYKVLRVGDIAFEGHTNKQFRFGRFVVNDIGTGIMSPRFSTLRPLNEMPVNFWKQYIHSESVMRRILVNSTKAGTMMNELVIPEFLNQTIMVPSENEQAVIGQYFTNLDHLITLHQRKCEELQKIKKFMLQNMFV